MKRQLQAALTSPDLAQRLRALAADAPASALVSVGIDLGPGEADCLDCLPDTTDCWYWAQPRRCDYRLGLGTALQLSSLGPARFAALQAGFAGITRNWRHDFRQDQPPAAFLGFAFDEAARGELPNALLAVPAIEVRSRAGRCRGIFTTLAGDADSAVACWQELLAPTGAAAPAALPPPTRHPLAERAWQARVEAALRDIAGGSLDKVVLARSLRLAAAAPIAAAPLLAALLAGQPDATVYAHRSRQRLFLGASPECLARLQAGRAEADALAGTAWPAAAGGLDGDKNRREQQLVADAVKAALAPLCSRLDTAAAPEILELPQLSHLRSRLGGEARPGTSLFDLLRALHPTPAVGGSPAPAALDWLRRHGEKRGAWYSGGIGHMAADGEGEVAVALRCALISGSEAELYAGAGIVAGSDPAQELAETEAKLATLLAVLCPPERHPARTGTR